MKTALLLVCALAIVAVTADLVAISPAVSKAVAKGETVSVLLRLRGGADPRDLAAEANGNHHLKGRLVYEGLAAAAAAAQAPVLARLAAVPALRARGYWISNVIAVHGVRVEHLSFLSSLPGLSQIEPNMPFRVDLEEIESSTNDDDARLEWNVQWVNADRVWAEFGNTGQDGSVLLADTGTEHIHPEISQSYRGANSSTGHAYHWWDGVKEAALPGEGPCGIDSRTPCDDHNHGTHVTGTAAGTNGCGVAPGASWLGCRNMDRGFGTPESYISCLQFSIAPTDLDGNNADPDVRPDAVGNSYGCPAVEGCAYNTLHDAVEAVRAAGVFMSVSSGNAGSSCSSIHDPPGLEPSVISVGATGSRTDAIASYSSRGPVTVWGGSLRKPELVAPGSGVRSSVRNGGYASYSGTSMASPHVTGAVALVVTACPELKYDVDGIQSLLEQTATPLTSSQGCGSDSSSAVPNNVYGHGQLNVYAAVTACMARRQ